MSTHEEPRGTFRAVFIGGPADETIEDVPLPTPGTLERGGERYALGWVTVERGAEKGLATYFVELAPPCTHPPARLWVWRGRDDTAPGGYVLCIACCDCGAVLQGAGALPSDEEPPAA